VVVRSATSCPIELLGWPPVFAVKLPVAPAADWMYPAPSAPRLQVRFGQSTWYSWVREDGGRIVLLDVAP
jgi:hypothetical protein